MATEKQINEIRHPKIRINPELDKYKDVVLFPEKLEQAKEALKKNPIPAHLLNGTKKKPVK